MQTTDQLIEFLYPGIKNVIKIYPTVSAINALKKEVSKITGLPYESFDKKTNQRAHVTSRQLASVALKIFTNYSLAEIGDNIGNKNHATVMNSIKIVAALVETDSYYRANYNKVITAAEKVFKSDRLQRPMNKKHKGIISRDLWRYAVTVLKSEITDQEAVRTKSSHFNKLTRLEDIIKDKDREIRMLKGQVERSRIKNSYEYVD